jgi:hypothetical protein
VTYVSVVAAVVIVWAVADSRGALTTSTYLGLAVGVAFLWWLGRRRTQRLALPHPLTPLYIARERFAHGGMSVEEFEREATDLLESGTADEPVRLVIVDQPLLLDGG